MYLLKPIDPENLKSKLTNLCAQIQSDNIVDMEYESLKTKSGMQSADMSCRIAGTSRIIQNVMADINENYAQDFNLSKIAEKYQLSYSYLSLMFKKETKQNIIDYLNSVRIERAKALLRDPTIRICTISDMVGIADSHYFARLFRKYTGKSPSEYRALFL